MKAEKYVLDTNIITYLYQTDSPLHQNVFSHLSELSDAEIYVSLFSLFEIENGIAVSTDNHIKNTFLLMRESIQQHFPILLPSLRNAEVFGIIKAAYIHQTGISKNAVKRHDIDFMIAATAVSENAVLVSNDRIFHMIEELCADFFLENWAVG